MIVDQHMLHHPTNSIDYSKYTDVWLQYSIAEPGMTEHLNAISHNRRTHHYSIFLVPDGCRIRKVGKLVLRRTVYPCCVLGQYSCSKQGQIYYTSDTPHRFSTCTHTHTAIHYTCSAAHSTLTPYANDWLRHNSTTDTCTYTVDVPH